ncbi:MULTISPECIES: 4-alpha-glucanotransferase [Clostridium]|uniref:4-alpha-glucanotransferase n=1 Tax=Clostridium TaxID=1485 RepID=UPI0004D465B2|nr:MULTISPECIES: 4-alpha-glucanotransferase [Clostridium]KEH89894.1 4-alpha-glucanotransferase [Clostridium novyi A str. 4540]KEH95146.1 4-alpha-glucanotransferase [Clostridium botulinum C/D str. It1]
MFERSSGILMHITSLPSPYGIGTLGKEAYRFVDFLVKAGQKYWQVLPLGPTGYGDSPYQSFSAFAGNPYLIDLDLLCKEGLLEVNDYKYINFGYNCEEVDFEKIAENKMPILKMAFKNLKDKYRDELQQFKEENDEWIEDYALYMALKVKNNLKSWQLWDKDIKLRKKDALNKAKKELKDDIDYNIFLQFMFYKQWNNLKEYANKNGIKIIGDIPIYVAEDSADTWASSELFLLDKDKRPIVVSGCPPDGFSETGQRWGNPIYNWKYLEETNYSWWVKRIKANSKLYDVTRIDHFRGFESYWQVPYGEETAINGEWVKGPAMKLFNVIKKELGDVDIIAEDLGYLTDEVRKFREDSGYPGMKVLEFAFDAREESDYLPHNYDKDCVVYTGTHDNDTVNGWFENANKSDVDFAIKYLKLTKEEGYNWGFIRGALSSVASLAIAQFQDYLGLGTEARMNIPSTLGGNWRWRAKKKDINGDLSKKICEITKLYGR